jgi:hypothetical protein
MVMEVVAVMDDTMGEVAVTQSVVVKMLAQ